MDPSASSATRRLDVLLGQLQGPKKSADLSVLETSISEHFEKHQATLPRLPVPDLGDSCDKYLKAIKPLISEYEYQKSVAAVEEFCGGVGRKLQQELVDRNAPNYVEEFWDDMYLNGRWPLVVHSNPFYLLKSDPIPNSQIERATQVCVSSAKFAQALWEGRSLPGKFRRAGICMFEFARLMGGTRLPGVGRDRLAYDQAEAAPLPPRHCLVLAPAGMFRLQLLDDAGAVKQPADVAAALRRIVAASSPRAAAGGGGAGGEGEGGAAVSEACAVGVLTSAERDTWARARAELERSAVNRSTLAAIDSALFVVVLDNSAPASLSELAPIALHSNGRMLWADKSFTLTVTANGMLTCCMEHSWGDGQTTDRYLREVMGDIYGNHALHRLPAMTARMAATPSPCELQPLQWHISDATAASIQSAQADLNTLAASVDIRVFQFPHFGTAALKKFRMSPDGLVQTAMQLAYFRLHGRTVSTYESGSTKTFLHGRTETIRSATPQSRQFVLAFSGIHPAAATAAALTDDQKEHLRSLLQGAVSTHASITRAAAKGQGFDRHLFCLYSLAARKAAAAAAAATASTSGDAASSGGGSFGGAGGAACGIPSMFTDPSFGLLNTVVLSTSTLSGPHMEACGFGPVSSSGYGIGYTYTQDRLTFCISTFRDDAATATTPRDPAVLAAQIETALLDIAALLQDD